MPGSLWASQQNRQRKKMNLDQSGWDAIPNETGLRQAIWVNERHKKGHLVALPYALYLCSSFLCQCVLPFVWVCLSENRVPAKSNGGCPWILHNCNLCVFWVTNYFLETPTSIIHWFIISIYFSMVVKPNFQAHKPRLNFGDITWKTSQWTWHNVYIYPNTLWMPYVKIRTFSLPHTVDYNYIATQSGVCVARLFMWIYYPRQYLLPYGYQQFVWIGFRHFYTI